MRTDDRERDRLRFESRSDRDREPREPARRENIVQKEFRDRWERESGRAERKDIYRYSNERIDMAGCSTYSLVCLIGM